MSARDALFQHSRIPRQVDVDDGIRCLEVEPRRTRVRCQEQPAARITLKLVYQLLALLLRDGSVQPHVVELNRLICRSIKVSIVVHSEKRTILRASSAASSSNNSSSLSSLLQS